MGERNLASHPTQQVFEIFSACMLETDYHCVIFSTEVHMMLAEDPQVVLDTNCQLLQL